MCVRDDVLRNCSLHRNQFVYQAGKFTEAALHNVVILGNNFVSGSDIAS
jgi:hypothetical protein